MQRGLQPARQQLLGAAIPDPRAILVLAGLRFIAFLYPCANSPLKNATSRGSRANEAQISSETGAIGEPPHIS